MVICVIGWVTLLFDRDQCKLLLTLALLFRTGSVIHTFLIPFGQFRTTPRQAPLEPAKVGDYPVRIPGNMGGHSIVKITTQTNFGE